MPLDPSDFENVRSNLKPLIRRHLDERAQARIDSSDILMDSIERAMNAQGDRFEEMTNEERIAYLRKSLITVAIDVYRRHVKSEKRSVARERPIDQGASSGISPIIAVARNPAPDEMAISNELIRLVEAALTQLPEVRRNVFRLKVFDGYSIRAAAKKLGISFGKAARYYEDSMQHVRLELERIFGES